MLLQQVMTEIIEAIVLAYKKEDNPNKKVKMLTTALMWL